MGERIWVAVKTHSRKILLWLKHLLNKNKEKSGANDEISTFQRRLNARMSILDGKVNMLLYGAPRNDAFALKALESADLDADLIAADFLSRRELKARDRFRELYSVQFKSIYKSMLRASAANSRNILSLSATHVPKIDSIRNCLKFLQTFTVVSRNGIFPDSNSEQIPTDPLTALKVLTDRKFDLIFCLGTLETLTPREQIQLLVRALRMLSPNGTLILQLPNLNNETIIRDQYWGNPDFLRLFSVTEIEEILLSQSGFTMTRGYWKANGRLARIPVGTKLSKIPSESKSIFFIVTADAE